MPIRFGLILAIIAAAHTAAAQALPQGQVELPLEELEDMLAEVEAAQQPPTPLVDVTPIRRSIQGRFDKGLFSAELVTRFRVNTSKGHLRVPVLDGAAALDDVRLDGRQTSLLRDGRMYTVGVDAAGEHEVRLKFYWGEEQDRFSRRLRFRLPEGGSTRLQVLLPEQDIEATLAQGAIESTTARGAGTELVGYLDGRGELDLSWTRRVAHEEGQDARLAAKVYSVFTLEQAIVNGQTSVEIEVKEGETDRVELMLPPEVEILRVEGEAVLQWQTDPSDGGRLVVLLRYRVNVSTKLSVAFQYERPPEDQADATVPLLFPRPAEGVPMEGALGVQGSPGMEAQVASVEKAEALTLRDVPASLVSLSPQPLLLAFAFREPPSIALQVQRLGEVELTTTVINDLQASTVVIEDGTQITKLKLRVRNNTRQYLTVELPADAELTHALIDGAPVRPAARPDAGHVLLFPLRQSEKVESTDTRIHIVQLGETLSEIANTYYGDATAWRRILEGNPNELLSPGDLYVGQQLVIPRGPEMRESTFVIELAYKEKATPLGWFGRRDLVLPQVDKAVDVTKATWHVYFPDRLTPVSFSGNLLQYSALRYDPFRRVRDFLRRAWQVNDAWAGGPSRYKSILSQRREIYEQEVQKKAQGGVVLTSFPLVGQRYRFGRELSGSEQPRLTVTYLPKDIHPPLRWLALLMAAVGVGWLVRAPGERRRWWILGGATVVWLVIAHYVLGVHRHLLWGIDLALLGLWLRHHAPSAWRSTRAFVNEPWRVFDLLRLRTLLLLVGTVTVTGVLLTVPMLLSSFTAVALAVWAWRSRREVAHA